MTTAVPILVVSCDKYADLWRPFFSLLWRHWPDCPYAVFLGTNHLSYSDPRVQTLAIGDDVSWASGLNAMIDRLDSRTVIILLDDFLLTEDVSSRAIERLIRVAEDERVGCLRLYSIYPPEHPVAGHNDLGDFAPGDRWRITAQAAIWQTDFLRRLLVPGFSAWDFELLGSQMSDYMPERVWGVRSPVIVYDHGVEKGRWRPQGLDICRAAGVGVDVTKRGVFSEQDLEALTAASSVDAEFAEHQTDALLDFRRGSRASALRHIAWCLRRRPLSPAVYALAAAGVIGPGAVSTLHKVHLRARAAQAQQRYRMRAQAMRERPGKQ
jgi:hypothetical protein